MEYQVKTAHGTLFCRREGSGPLLLLIHGVACDSEFFTEVYRDGFLWSSLYWSMQTIRSKWW